MQRSLLYLLLSGFLAVSLLAGVARADGSIADLPGPTPTATPAPSPTDTPAATPLPTPAPDLSDTGADSTGLLVVASLAVVGLSIARLRVRR